MKSVNWVAAAFRLRDGKRSAYAVAVVVAGLLAGAPSAPASQDDLQVSGDLPSFDGAFIGPSGLAYSARAAGTGSLTIREVIGSTRTTVASEDCDTPCSLRVDEYAEAPKDASGPVAVAIEAWSGDALLARRSYHFIVDRQPPALELGGELARLAGSRTAVDRSSVLNIAARDGGGAQSGVSQLEVLANGFMVETFDQDCRATGCVLIRSFRYNNAGYGPGEQTITVRASDGVGNTSSETITVEDQSPISDCRPGLYKSSGGQPCEMRFDECAQSTAPARQGSSLADARAAEGVRRVRERNGVLLERSSASGSLRPRFSLRHGYHRIDGSNSVGAIPVRPDAGIGLGGSSSSLCITPLGTNPDATDAVLAGDSAAVYADTFASTETVVRPVANGAEVYEHIRNSDAPETFTWSVKIPSGQSLIQLDEKHVAVVDDAPSSRPDSGATFNDRFVRSDAPDTKTQAETADAVRRVAEERAGAAVHAVIAAPGTVDADGKPIVTRLSVDGNRVTMTVRHRRPGVVYPAVADPVFYQFYIVRALTYNVLGWYNQRVAQGYYVPFSGWNVGSELGVSYGQSWPTSDAVIGLQEICKEDRAAIKSRLQAYGVYVTIVHAQTAAVAGCTFGIATAYPWQMAYSPEASCKLHIPRGVYPACNTAGFTGNENPESRRVTRGTVWFPQAPLRVFNTQLGKPPMPPLTDPTQYWLHSPAEAVRDIVQADPSINKVVMGDFNIPYAGSSCPGAQDIWYNRWNQLPSFYPGGALYLNEADGSNTVTNACGKLDYIFATHGLPYGGGTNTITHNGVSVVQYGSSDHKVIADSLAIIRR